MSVVTVFVAGAATLGFLLSALFFFRFWSRTRDSLFAAFGTAFCLLAFHQAIVALIPPEGEYQSWVYLLKLAAFALLAIAIVRKNVEPPSDRAG